MNGVIAGITLRQLLSRRRTILLLLLGWADAGGRLGAPPGRGGRRTWPRYTSVLLETFGIATLMPLVALLFGTATLGAELEEGTAIYLLAKPIPRWVTLITKLVDRLRLLDPADLRADASGRAARRRRPVRAGAGLHVRRAAIGSVIYCAIFVALSLVTGRALVFGLGYVLIWEGVLAGLFAGTQTFSVRQQTLAFADALTDAPLRRLQRAAGAGNRAGGWRAGAAAATVAIAIRRLTRIEIAGRRLPRPMGGEDWASLGPPWRTRCVGRVDERVIDSQALTGNPLGDPHRRPLLVQLPPAYEAEPERRFPVIYVLQGLSNAVDMWRNRRSWQRNPLEELDAALRRR